MKFNDIRENKEKRIVLKNLGFTCDNISSCTDGLIEDGKIEFDFSATSIQGIAHKIFYSGVEHGATKLRNDFLDLLQPNTKGE